MMFVSLKVGSVLRKCVSATPKMLQAGYLFGGEFLSSGMGSP